MIVLKEANLEDSKKQYEVLTSVPKEENGFTNPENGCTYEEYMNDILPYYFKQKQGIDLKPGFVPDTHYYLWDDDNIVGYFRFRHYLNDFLRDGPGHIGYCILKDYRNKGYGSKGLHLLIDEVKNSVLENELYLSVLKSNPASLKVMENNGGCIHHEDDSEYYVRIKVK